MIAKTSAASVQIPKKASVKEAVSAQKQQQDETPPTRPLPALLRKRIWAFSGLSVVLMTALLYGLQAFLIQYDGHKTIRPFAVGYLVPIILITALAGRGAGFFTLCLSCLATAFFLAQPYFSYHIASVRTQVEMLLLLTVGLSAIFTVGAGQEKAMMLADMGGTTEGNALQRQIRQATEAVPGVRLMQGCILRRRGVDLYVDVDVLVNEKLTQTETREITDAVEQAICRMNPLIFRARARTR